MSWLPAVLVVLGLSAALVIWLVVVLMRTAGRIEELNRRQARVERDLGQLRERFVATLQPVAAEKPAVSVPPASAAETLSAAQGRVQESDRQAESVESVTSPPARPEPIKVASWEASVLPPPRPPALPPRAPAPSEPAFSGKPASETINWEQFVGVKLLMWLGGLAAFLFVVFAVKYSFDRNWITPELRVAGGFLIGTGLLVGGAILHRRKQYLVGAQTLCATGIVVLYATTFAARAFYRLLAWPDRWWDALPAFAIMVLITATGFLLAVRLNALVVAILGLCGGFLSPVLINTGQDNPFGLFGYIALLDAGLIAVALRKRWHFLALMGAAGTVLMQLGWASEFFVREKYFQGNKILIALAVFLSFSVLFVAVWTWAQRQRAENIWLTVSAIALPAVALLFGFYLMGFDPLAQRPGVVFGYVLLIDLCLLTLVCMEAKLAGLQMAVGGLVFLLLTVWTLRHLSNDLLNWALVLYLVFAILHSALPFVLDRLRRGATPLWWGHLFPLMALLLVLAPIFKLHAVSLVLWPFVLLVDLLAIVLAVLSASALWVLGALVLTLIVAGCWITEAPPQLAMLPDELIVIGGCAVFFFAAGVFAAKKLRTASADPETGAAAGPPTAVWPWPGMMPEAVVLQVPAFAATLPFALLIMVSLRLPLADPSPVFGLALLLVVLLLGLARWFALSWLPALGLGCVLALEHAWQLQHFKPDAAVTPLLWYLGFVLVFSGFPFLFWRQLAGQVTPWAAAALAGPLHFYLVQRLVKAAWPNDYMGLLPVAFALPSTLGLVFLIRVLAADARKRTTLLAFFGAAALFFVTLIFPIQFDRQWITIGWALEGAALLWLFHRVPHNGLRLAGLGLLITAFVRLALNPAVLHYHARAAAPLLNWYLYAYGLVTACLFAGASLLAPPRHLVLNSNARACLATLGTVLAFLLLNIEIADYFTEAGAAALTFEFSGNLARDMTYSIAWGGFALGLVVAGIGWKIRADRYAGICLLCVTLLKLFLHDLASLQALYRIGALLGVAIIAIAASFLYQRFFADQPKEARGVADANPAPPAA